MEKEFVTYKQALALKELGFDEPCIASYTSTGEFKDPFDYTPSVIGDNGYVTNSSLRDPNNFNARSNFKLLKEYMDNPFTAAPLKSQIFKWFREKHKLFPDIFVDDNKTFGFMISYFVEEGRADTAITRDFKTYEDVQDATIDKLILMTKNQKQ